MMSIRAVNALAHYTNWVIGHVHSGALGWVGMISFGMMYWMVPRTSGGGRSAKHPTWAGAPLLARDHRHRDLHDRHVGRRPHGRAAVAGPQRRGSAGQPDLPRHHRTGSQPFYVAAPDRRDDVPRSAPSMMAINFWQTIRPGPKPPQSADSRGRRRGLDVGSTMTRPNRRRLRESGYGQFHRRVLEGRGALFAVRHHDRDQHRCDRGARPDVHRRIVWRPGNARAG